MMVTVVVLVVEAIVVGVVVMAAERLAFFVTGSKPIFSVSKPWGSSE